MAAGEDQAQPIVFYNLSLVGRRAVVSDRFDFIGDFAPGRHALLSAQLINGLESSRRDEPGNGVLRYSLALPNLGGRHEGVMQSIFGEFEVRSRPVAAQASRTRGGFRAGRSPESGLTLGEGATFYWRHARSNQSLSLAERRAAKDATGPQTPSIEFAQIESVRKSPRSLAAESGAAWRPRRAG
jgi:hypothetical protein